MNNKNTLLLILSIISFLFVIASVSASDWTNNRDMGAAGSGLTIVGNVTFNSTYYVTSINLTNNITTYVTNNTYYNITNNITNNITTTYNITNNNTYIVGMNYTNLALTNESEDWGVNNLTTGGWFNGKFNWTALANWLHFDGILLTFNETHFNQSSIAIGLAAGFNSTYNATYDTHVNNATLHNDSTFNASYATALNNGSYLSTYNVTYDTHINNATQHNSSSYNASYVPYTGATNNIDIGKHNITLNGTISWLEQTGIQNLFHINPLNGDGFRMEYWYDFEAANDDWWVFLKTDGNDARPDGGIAFMMRNASGYNDTVLKIDGYGLANFTDYNITTTGYYDGQPLTGMLGSGIIWANGTNNFAEVVVQCTGLSCGYSAFKVRLVNSTNDVKYCDIPNATRTVTNNQHSVLYIDNACAVQETSISTYLTTPISPGGIADFANIVAVDGSTYNQNGIGLENKRIIKLRKLLMQSTGRHLSIVDGGFNLQQNPNFRFNITAGQYVYLMDIVATTTKNTSVDKNEIVYHTGAATWGESDQTALNVTTCDTGTGIADCTNPTRYRRAFIFMIGYNESTDQTQIHQLLPLQSVSYTTIADCLNTNTNPITYSMPAFYQYAAVPLYAYCAKATDTTWSAGQTIDLRASSGGAIGSGGTTDISTLVPYVGATTQVNLGTYNMTTGGWFNGNFNWTALANWLHFDGFLLTFNETHFNQSVISTGIAAGFNDTAIGTKIKYATENNSILFIDGTGGLAISTNLKYGNGRINLTQLNGIEPLLVKGNATIVGNVTSYGWFNGRYNWTALANWLGFDGSTLTFNESHFNDSVIALGNAAGYNSTYNETYDLHYKNTTLHNDSTYNATYAGTTTNWEGNYTAYMKYWVNHTLYAIQYFEAQVGLNQTTWTQTYNATYAGTTTNWEGNYSATSKYWYNSSTYDQSYAASQAALDNNHKHSTSNLTSGTVPVNLDMATNTNITNLGYIRFYKISGTCDLTTNGSICSNTTGTYIVG